MLGGRFVCSVVAALAVGAIAPIAKAEPVRAVLLTPPTMSVSPGQRLPVALAVRIERADGHVVPGAQVVFVVNLCFEVLGVRCPAESEYGQFETSGPDRLSAVVATDLAGAAVAPAFQAGYPEAARMPFEFTIFPYVPAQTVPGSASISLTDALNPIGGFRVAATTIRIGEENTTVAPPSGLVATLLAPRRVELRWVDNAANDTAIEVELRRGGGPFALVATLEPNATRTVLKGLAKNARFAARLRSRNGTTASGYSERVVFITPR
jgi:hypothetical protein